MSSFKRSAQLIRNFLSPATPAIAGRRQDNAPWRLATLLLAALIVLPVLQAAAHVIPYVLDKKRLTPGDLFCEYLGHGYRHILPDGFDHILFITCVFFLSRDIKKVVLQASAFTVSHTITLALGMYGFINPPAKIVEPLIAISIVALALENVFSDKVKPWRLLLVFGFGLVHGMGFAAGLIDKLAENGLSRREFVPPLLGFSLGVELGQLTVILLLYFCISMPFSKKEWYRRRIVIPVSLAVALIAAYWTIDRIFINPPVYEVRGPKSVTAARDKSRAIPCAEL